MKKLSFVCISLLFLSSASFALSWNEAVDLFKKNDPLLKSSQKQLESVSAVYNKTFTAYFPSLSAALSTGRSYASSGTSSDLTTASLAMRQNIFAGMDNYFSTYRAKAELDAARAGFDRSLSDGLYRLRSAYIDIAMAAEGLELQKSILERRKNNTDLIKLRYDSGWEDRGAYLRTRADEADAVFGVDSVKREIELAGLRLSQLISTEVKGPVEAGSVKAMTAPDIFSLASNSPDMVSAEKQKELAEIDLKRTVSGFLPDISLQGSFSRSGVTWPLNNENKSISLNMSYQFFPGGSNIADVAIYRAKADKAAADHQAAKDSVRYTVSSAYLSFVNSVQALEVADLYLQAARERSDIARTKYINGLINYDDWDRIENEYINAEKLVLARKKSALMSEAAWHNSYGGYVK